MTAVATLERCCACGCGRPVNGRRSTRRFASTACRVRAHRGRGPNVDSPPRQMAKKPPQQARPLSQATPHDRVTLTDGPDVACGGCGVVLPGLEGPLPAPAYCRACGTQGSFGTLGPLKGGDL